MPALTEPVRLGGRLAPSRVLFGPHVTNLGRGRELSARHTAYYAARAAGGAGVVVTEVASVTADDRPYERAPLASACAPGWAQVADAVHARGALLLAGLGHAGSQGTSAYSEQVLLAPSAVPDPCSREMPAAMTGADISAVVAGFAGAARLAVGAGADGVEVDAGAVSLLRQFSSALTNRRDDGYGTDRLRLTREVLAVVRGAVGDGVLSLRLSCDELAPWAGTTPAAALAQVRELAPLVDLLVVVRGGPYAPGADRPDAHEPAVLNRDLCAAVRRVAGGVPVVLQGSVVDPADAQQALDDGVADLVEMTRAQIADPGLVAAVRAGHPERVRPCVLCNQACCVRDVRNPEVSCVLEPRSGWETHLPDPVAQEVPDAPAPVLVVGGGPAGLEAARVLAHRGHAVHLVERSDRLGGTLAAASVGPGRERMSAFTRWQEAECRRLGVRVSTEVVVTAADLDAVRADGGEVLLATGSRPAPAPWSARDPGTGPTAPQDGTSRDGTSRHGATTAQVDVLDLLGADPGSLPPGAVLVHDPVGGPVGVGAAEWLVAAGRREVTVVTPDPVVGSRLTRTGDLAAAGARLQRAGIGRAVRSRVRAAGGGRADIEDVWTGRRREVGCAVLVDAGHRLPEDELAAARPDLPRAGDVVAPRTVLEAVLEGRRRALDVGRGRSPATAQAEAPTAAAH